MHNSVSGPTLGDGSSERVLPPLRSWSARLFVPPRFKADALSSGLDGDCRAGDETSAAGPCETGMVQPADVAAGLGEPSEETGF